MSIESLAAAPETGAGIRKSGGFEIRPLNAPLGAEVLGLNLSQPLDAEGFGRIHAAHLEHRLLIFRDQRISPDQQVEFSRRFGPLQIHVQRRFQLDGHPEVLIVSNIRDENGEPTGLGDAGLFWHSDLSYKDKPSLGSLLHAQELPAEGGDTLFSDVHQLWTALPAHLRKAVEGRSAEHSYLARYAELQRRSPWRPDLTPRQRQEVPPVVHPIVRTHPETQLPALFVNEHFTTRIVGIPEDESRQILAELYAWVPHPEFVYRHHWQPHDLLFWDNRCLQHLAAGTPDHLRRRLYRTTIEGGRPF